MNKTYWASVEYQYMEGAENFGKFAGGFVYIFMTAVDVRDAIQKIEEELLNLHLNIKLIEFVEPYEDIPWDTPKEQLKYDKLAAEATTMNKVLCDDFMAYEIEID